MGPKAPVFSEVSISLAFLFWGWAVWGPTEHPGSGGITAHSRLGADGGVGWGLEGGTWGSGVVPGLVSCG